MAMRSAILLVSLAANVALGVWLVGRPRTSEPASPAPLPAPSSVESTAAQKSFSAQKTSSADGPVPLLDSGPAFHWSQLESSDYKEYISRLRAFGVPEKTVRDIIYADVAKLYRPRLLALQPPPSTRTNFWEDYSSYTRPQRTKEQREQYRAL